MKKSIIFLTLLLIVSVKSNPVQAMVSSRLNSTATYEKSVAVNYTTNNENNSQKQVIDLDLPENEKKYNIFVGDSFRIDPFISGYQTKAVYVSSVGNYQTGGVYSIPDNVVLKKTLNVYKYMQKGQHTDFTMLVTNNTQLVSKEVMTFTKEKPYFVKEYSVGLPNIGYTQGLSLIKGNVSYTATLSNGLYMDGGANKAGSFVANFQGPYDRNIKYIPWDEVDKDSIVRKYTDAYNTNKNEASTHNDEYTYKALFYDGYNGIYKINKNTDEKIKLADGDGSIFCIDGDYIYYAVSTDNYKLNRMRKDGSDKTYMGVDFIRKLKYYNGWFYFTTSRSGANIYKMKLDGSDLTPIDNDVAVDFMDICGDYIYYQNYSDGNKLYRIKMDGTDREKISDLSLYSLGISIQNNSIYYEDKKNFYKMNLDGTGVQVLKEPETNTQEQDNNISDGVNGGQLQVTTGTPNVNLKQGSGNNGNLYNGGLYAKDGEWIYYSEGGIWKLNTVTGEKALVCTGNTTSYSKICIEGYWVYFIDTKSQEGYQLSSIWKVKKDGTNKTFILNLGLGSSTIGVYNSNVYHFGSINFNPVDVSVGSKLFKRGVNDNTSLEFSPSTINSSFSIEDGYMYYSVADDKKFNTYICRVNLNTLEKRLYKTKNYMTKFFFTDNGWIYYTSGNDINRISVDGTSDTKIADAYNGVQAINVKDDWVYYSEVANQQKLYKIKTDGTQKTLLLDGQIGVIYRIFIIDDYIYSKYIDKKYKYVTWKMKIDGTDGKLI